MVNDQFQNDFRSIAGESPQNALENIQTTPKMPKWGWAILGVFILIIIALSITLLLPKADQALAPEPIQQEKVPEVIPVVEDIEQEKVPTASALCYSCGDIPFPYEGLKECQEACEREMLLEKGCIEIGGAYKAYIDEESFCCEGLNPSPLLIYSRDEITISKTGCPEYDLRADALIDFACIKRGDGVCNYYENSCNSKDCKHITCTSNIDCPSEMECKENVCISNCIVEGDAIGGTGKVILPAGTPTECCEGFNLIYSKGDFDKNCDSTVHLYPSRICSDCGNGICEDWESKCNCPEDCE